MSVYVFAFVLEYICMLAFISECVYASVCTCQNDGLVGRKCIWVSLLVGLWCIILDMCTICCLFRMYEHLPKQTYKSTVNVISFNQIYKQIYKLTNKGNQYIQLHFIHSCLYNHYNTYNLQQYGIVFVFSKKFRFMCLSMVETQRYISLYAN